MLEHRSASRRVWIEFEVSRADPVANHAKFGASAFLEGPSRDGDAFVSMASRHIAPGRLALAAGTAMLMRGIGIAAFQVDLLPQFDAATIKRLNSRRDLAGTKIDARGELERALQVSDAELTDGGHRIHKVDNRFSVAMNVRQWNAEMLDSALAALWGRRRVGYFTYDAASGLFAPTKFSAFVPTVKTAAAAKLPALLDGRPAGMTMPIYSTLNERDRRFDGHIAWQHLQRALGYLVLELDRSSAAVQAQFWSWLGRVEQWVQPRARVTLLLPPAHAAS